MRELKKILNTKAQEGEIDVTTLNHEGINSILFQIEQEIVNLAGMIRTAERDAQYFKKSLDKLLEDAEILSTQLEVLEVPDADRN